MNYGYHLSIRKDGILVMLNGRAFSLYKGMNSGRWHFDIWSNIWRKTKTPLPKDSL